MNYKININKEFIKIEDLENKTIFENNNFSNTLQNIFNNIQNKLLQNKDLLYHVFPIDNEIKEDKKISYINKYFETSIKDITILGNNIKLFDEMLIKIDNDKINKSEVIDIISNFSILYKDVILFNLYYDNPINNIFYILCKGKQTNINEIKINKNYSLNINKNKSYIYDFLFSYYASLTNIINIFDNLDNKQNINMYKIYLSNFKDILKNE